MRGQGDGEKERKREGERERDAQRKSLQLFHFVHRCGCDGSPALDKAIFADGANGFAENAGRIGKAAFRRAHGNVKGNGAKRGGDGQDDHEVGASLIEGVHGSDEDGTPARLLVPAHGIEIGQPDVAANGVRCGRWHRSGRIFLQSIAEGAVERLHLLTVSAGRGRVVGQRSISQIGLMEEMLATVVFQSSIEDIGHRGTGLLGEPPKEVPAMIGDSNGRRHGVDFTFL